MPRADFFKLITAILISELAGAVGSVFTVHAISVWYTALQKPSFAPPNWIFGPVWITLYLLMGVAAFLVWRKGLETRGIKRALLLFGFQLFLNALWPIIFFGLQNIGAAFLEIIILWLAILFTCARFYKISRLTVCLLLPYLLWVAFAAYLNYSIWMLN